MHDGSPYHLQEVRIPVSSLSDGESTETRCGRSGGSTTSSTFGGCPQHGAPYSDFRPPLGAKPGASQPRLKVPTELAPRKTTGGAEQSWTSQPFEPGAVALPTQDVARAAPPPPTISGAAGVKAAPLGLGSILPPPAYGEPSPRKKIKEIGAIAPMVPVLQGAATTPLGRGGASSPSTQGFGAPLGSTPASSGFPPLRAIQEMMDAAPAPPLGLSAASPSMASGAGASGIFPRNPPRWRFGIQQP